MDYSHQRRFCYIILGNLYTTCCLSRQMASRAAMAFIHRSRLSLPNHSMVSQVCPVSFIAISTVRRHVVFRSPLFLLPSGIQHTAVLVMGVSSFRGEWSVHLHCLLVMKVHMLSSLVSSSSCSVEIFVTQNVFRILRRLVVWKEDSLDMSCSVIRQHSDP